MIIDKRLLPIDDLYVLKIGGYILKNVLMAGLISVSVSSLKGGYRACRNKETKQNKCHYYKRNFLRFFFVVNGQGHL